MLRSIVRMHSTFLAWSTALVVSVDGHYVYSHPFSFSYVLILGRLSGRRVMDRWGGSGGLACLGYCRPMLFSFILIMLEPLLRLFGRFSETISPLFHMGFLSFLDIFCR